MYLERFLQAKDFTQQSDRHRKRLNRSRSDGSTEQLPVSKASHEPLTTTASSARPHVAVLEKQHAEVLLQAGCPGVLPDGVHGSPPTPKGRGLRHAACPQPPPSWHREESRRPQPELSSTAACGLACFYSEERLEDGRYENNQAERLVLPFAWCVSSRRALGEVGSPCWCRWLPPCGAESQGPPKALDVTEDAHYRLCTAYRERAVRAWQERTTAMFPFCVHTRVLTLSHTQIL